MSPTPPPITFLTASHAVSVALKIPRFSAFCFLKPSRTLSRSLTRAEVLRGSGALAEVGEVHLEA